MYQRQAPAALLAGESLTNQGFLLSLSPIALLENEKVTTRSGGFVDRIIVFSITEHIRAIVDSIWRMDGVTKV